jgi:transposase
MLSSIRMDGRSECMVVDGATDSEVFLAYIRHILVPALKVGDCVIMDNLSPHKTPEVERLIRGAGADVRWLPPYSPDLNPIEKMWSKIKQWLRSAKARTQEALEIAIAQALKAITPEDAANWFASCGYTIT